MQQIVFTAFDHGIFHFDLANNYGPMYGAAERNFGHIMRESLRPYRDELIISTKAGFDMWAGPNGVGGSRKYLLSSLDQSLERLGLDYVDIFYHHCPDPNTPLEETVGALETAVTSGRALYVGLSNRYNIFDRTIERNGLKEATSKLGKGLITFSPLEQGLLTNRYLNGIPADSRIGHDDRFLNKSALTESRLTQIRELNDLALSRGQTLAEMSLAWLLNDPAVTTVLVGASKPQQILDDIAALNNTHFTPEELARIDSISL